MRYLRLFSVLFLSAFAITGCHRRRAQVLPPHQAQAPIVTTLPPIPPLTFPDVEVAKPKPVTPVVPVVAPEPPPPKKTERVHHRRTRHKAEPETTAAASTDNSSSPASENSQPVSAASALGQLSADDATVNPHQNVQTQSLIEETESRLKKISSAQQAAHKDDIVQVSSFLTQAKQALGMNDIVGAQTLANKAKILLDELLK